MLQLQSVSSVDDLGGSIVEYNKAEYLLTDQPSNAELAGLENASRNAHLNQAQTIIDISDQKALIDVVKTGRNSSSALKLKSTLSKKKQHQNKKLRNNEDLTNRNDNASDYQKGSKRGYALNTSFVRDFSSLKT